MSLWKNIHRLATNPAVQGVIDPGPVDVVTPLQAVQIVDDATRGTRPLPVPAGIAQNNATAPGAANHTALEIVAGAGGLWLFEVDAPSGMLFDIFTQTTMFSPVVARAPITRLQATQPPATQFNTVAILAANLPPTRVAWFASAFESFGTFSDGLYVPPNSVWYFSGQFVGAMLPVAVIFREVPTT